MNSGRDLFRVFLLAAILPTAIVLVDQWAIHAVAGGPASTVGVYALFVGQVGLLAWIAGRWLPHPVLCGMVYARDLVLVDLWLLSLAGSYYARPLSYAMISAQVDKMVGPVTHI